MDASTDTPTTIQEDIKELRRIIEKLNHLSIVDGGQDVWGDFLAIVQDAETLQQQVLHEIEFREAAGAPLSSQPVVAHIYAVTNPDIDDESYKSHHDRSRRTIPVDTWPGRRNVGAYDTGSDANVIYLFRDALPDSSA